MATAAVLGASGYLGTELLRVLSYHPELEVTAALSQSHADSTLAEVSPQLERFGNLRLTADPAQVDTDVAFLAQPAGEAMKVVPGLLERGVKVVDLGPDYRLATADQYESVYGRPHQDAEHLAEAVYGLPELFHERIRSARLVANPGCYPTATLLALAPLYRAGEVAGPVIVDAKSGSSGVGAAPSTESHHPDAALTVRPYGTPTHRHVPEMQRVLGGLSPHAPNLVFVPHVVPLVRGILCSIYPTARAGTRAKEWQEILESAYSGSSFVRVGGIPKLPWAFGTNRCYLSVQDAGSTPVVFSAIDNLGKGGATQAVQNANLMMGWDETAGLAHPGFGV
ncbi:MAG TPA: N-acetyl-gamma-glutamyl-phosphate reductase [Thermoplasmata archaeon]|nr:N-acetyl-gamma-glutamyl-phosphate reductase [Thermoplasmata archaeon]